MAQRDSAARMNTVIGLKPGLFASKRAAHNSTRFLKRFLRAYRD